METTSTTSVTDLAEVIQKHGSAGLLDHARPGSQSAYRHFGGTVPQWGSASPSPFGARMKTAATPLTFKFVSSAKNRAIPISAN